MLEDCLVHYRVLENDTSKFVGKVSVEAHKSKSKEADYCVINFSKRE